MIPNCTSRSTMKRIVTLFVVIFLFFNNTTTSYAVIKNTPNPKTSSNKEKIVAVLKLNSGKIVVLKESVTGSPEYRIKSLKERNGVISVARTVPLYALGASDPLRSRQWHLNRLDIEKLDLANPTGSSVKIAVLDTGVDASHSDLSTLVLDGFDVYGKNLERNDPNGHGTHVAGIIAALKDNEIAGRGVVPGIKIMPIRVLDETGYGDDADVAKGVVWAVDNGANILNLSLGGDEYSQALKDSIAYAVSKNVIVVTAAGNSYLEGNPIIYPAAYPGSFAVGATMPGDTRAPFSTTGQYLDVSAPGFAIASTWLNNSISTQSGTSMAAPIVSAAAALIWATFPNLSAKEIEKKLTDSALDIGAKGRDDEFGFGIIDPLFAITGERSNPVALPAIPQLPTLPLPTLPIPKIIIPEIPKLPTRPDFKLPQPKELPNPVNPTPGTLPTFLLKPTIQVLGSVIQKGKPSKIKIWDPGNPLQNFSLKFQPLDSDKVIDITDGKLDDSGESIINYIFHTDGYLEVFIDRQTSQKLKITLSKITQYSYQKAGSRLYLKLTTSTNSDMLILEKYQTGGWVLIKEVGLTNKSVELTVPYSKGVYRFYLKNYPNDKFTFLL